MKIVRYHMDVCRHVFRNEDIFYGLSGMISEYVIPFCESQDGEMLFTTWYPVQCFFSRCCEIQVCLEYISMLSHYSSISFKNG